MEKTYCNCKIPANLQQDKMAKAIMDYISRIDPDFLTEDGEYERRLNICSGCQYLVNGLTCNQCGCFVLARARKVDSTCPSPKGNLWKL